MHVHCEGLVLKVTKFKDSDKILTIFSKSNGKIQAMAKGARKPKSSLMGSTQLFCHSDFMLYRGKSFYHLNQSEVINSFYNLREDIFKLAYATYIMEIVESGITEEEENEKIFLLVLKALDILSSGKVDYLKLTLAFKIKFISFLGYKPHLKSCVSCNGTLDGPLRFSRAHGGILCTKCLREDRYGDNISIEALKGLISLLYTPLHSLNEIELSSNTINIIDNILLKYILESLGKKSFKSLNFLKSIPK